jgi:hypothetical protein
MFKLFHEMDEDGSGLLSKAEIKVRSRAVRRGSGDDAGQRGGRV